MPYVLFLVSDNIGQTYLQASWVGVKLTLTNLIITSYGRAQISITETLGEESILPSS